MAMLPLMAPSFQILYLVVFQEARRPVHTRKRLQCYSGQSGGEQTGRFL